VTCAAASPARPASSFGGRFTPISWATSGEPLQGVADPVAAALESALALHRAGADPKALRRALRRIGELLDE
jgi:hypothetical protein